MKRDEHCVEVGLDLLPIKRYKSSSVVWRFDTERGYSHTQSREQVPGGKKTEKEEMGEGTEK